MLRLRDELARDVDRLNGVAITPSLAPDAVEMWFVRDGTWCTPQRFGFEVHEGKPVSLDHKLRETFAARRARESSPCASARSIWRCWRAGITRRWREGEWLGFDSYDDIPYRKLVNAVSRVARRDSGI